MSSRKSIGNTFTVTTMDDPVSLQAQYAPNANPSSSQIHTTWQAGDLYMRTKETDEDTWSDWHKIVGESGSDTNYSFALSAYTTPSANGYPSDLGAEDAYWSDAPMAITEQKPYLWSRVQKRHFENSLPVVDSTSYIRLTGEEGEEGKGYKATVYRDNLTLSNWNTYGTIGHAESWTNTESSRNGCGVGDLFLVVGKATDDSSYHKLTYRCDNSSGNLHGTCVEHQVTNDGKSAPHYFDEWFAWSNDETTSSVTTSPTISGSWQPSIPSQGGLAYLWRKSIRNVWNESTRSYTQEAAQYFRMSGTNGTSIHIKGHVSTIQSLPTTHEDGDAYVVDANGHLYMWSDESGSWVDIGVFQGEAGKTYYTHIAWATRVLFSDDVVTSVEGFVTTKSPNDTTHLWMGVLINENSGQDPSQANNYTWSYTKGVSGESAFTVDLSNETENIACSNDGKTIAVTDLFSQIFAFHGISSVVSNCLIKYVNKPANATPYIQSSGSGTSGSTQLTTAYQTIGAKQYIRLRFEKDANVGAHETLELSIQHATYGTLSITMTIVGLKGGATYHLVPSVSSISKDKNDVYNPTRVSCGYRKVDAMSGGVTNTPQEATLKYSVDNDTTMRTYTNELVAGTDFTQKVQFFLTVNEEIVDNETINVVSDGKDGTSPYLADLSNEMDSVQCDHNGKVLFTQSITSTLSMYKGSQVEAFAIDTIKRNGVTLTWDANNNGVWPRWNNTSKVVTIEFDNTATISNVDDFEISIHSASDTSITHTLHISINGVRANAVYRLIPSHSQIVKKKDGTYVPSVNITCSVQKIENGNPTTPSSSEYTLEKLVDNSQDGYVPYSPTSPSSIASDLKFRLKVNNVIVDMETVPLVEDGSKGENAEQYDIVFSEAWARVDSNGGITARLKGNAYKIVGATRTALPNATIRFGYILNDAQTYTTTSTDAFGFFDAGDWFDGDDVSDYAKNSANIFAAIIIGSNVVSTKYVTISKQGVKGDTGQTGKVGRFFYYANVWNASDNTHTYSATDAEAPYFRVGENYYVYVGTANWSNKTMYWINQNYSTPSSENENFRIMANDWKYIISQAVFTSFAMLGSAIFNKDWMISQYGTPSRTISAQEKSLVRNFVEVDGQYPVSTLATLLEDTDLWNEYVDYGYEDSEIEDVANVCIWAMSAMPNCTDAVRYAAIESIGDTSYSLFGVDSGNPFSVFDPNIALDFLHGKAFLNDCQVRGNLVGRVAQPFTNITNESEWLQYGVRTLDDYGYTRHYLFVNQMPNWNVLVDYMSGDETLKRALVLPVITKDLVGTEITVINMYEQDIHVEGKPEDSEHGDKGSYLLNGKSIFGRNGQYYRITMPSKTALKFIAVYSYANEENGNVFGWIAYGTPQPINEQLTT